MTPVHLRRKLAGTTGPRGVVWLDTVLGLAAALGLSIKPTVMLYDQVIHRSLPPRERLCIHLDSFSARLWLTPSGLLPLDRIGRTIAVKRHYVPHRAIGRQ